MTNRGNVYAEKMRRYRLILHTIFRLVTSNFLANENLQNRRRKLIPFHRKRVFYNVWIFLFLYKSAFSIIQYTSSTISKYGSNRKRYRLVQSFHWKGGRNSKNWCNGSCTLCVREYFAFTTLLDRRKLQELSNIGNTIEMGGKRKKMKIKKENKNQRVFRFATRCTTCNPSDAPLAGRRATRSTNYIIREDESRLRVSRFCLLPLVFRFSVNFFEMFLPKDIYRILQRSWECFDSNQISSSNSPPAVRS